MRREVILDTAVLPYCTDLGIAGATCHVRTNSHTVRDSLGTWQASTTDAKSGSFEMHVFVGSEGHHGSRQPHFRGARHLVTATFGEANAFVFDIARRKVVAAICEDVAADRDFWDRILLPIAIGVLGPALGVLPIHAACLTLGEAGMLIAGESGAGKSTLSLALAQHGFGYISDDWSYLSMRGGRSVAYGMSAPVKLLPDAVKHFPALSGYRPAPALNDELAYELRAGDLGANVRLSCEPQWFFFLERTSVPGCRLHSIGSDEAQRYVERSVERLPPELHEVICNRATLIENVSRLSCWRLCYGGPPAVAVEGLQSFFAQHHQEVLT